MPKQRGWGGERVYSDSDGRIRLQNSIICGNNASKGTALWANRYQILDIINCTIARNSSSSGSSFVCTSQNGHARLSNSILADGVSSVHSILAPLQIEYSNIQRGLSSIVDTDGTVVWGQGNLEVDPCFVNPGYWDGNGTESDPNDDIYVPGDYHLRSQAGRWDAESQIWICDEVTSPCIDTGDPNSPIMYEPFPNGGRINMGAYGGTAEASKSFFGKPVCETIVAGDINGDCQVDFKDLVILMRHWTASLESESPSDGGGRQNLNEAFR